MALMAARRVSTTELRYHIRRAQGASGKQLMSDLFQELEWRGQVSNATDGARELLAREKVTAYSGFDPTAASLHVGNLVPIMALKRVQRFGHNARHLLSRIE